MTARHDLRPDDTIRVLGRPMRAPTRYVTGARVGDLPRNGVVTLLRLGRIAVLRAGRVVAGSLADHDPYDPWMRCNGGTYDPWAGSVAVAPPNPRPPTTQRPCMCCGSPVASTGPGHRLCDQCRRRAD